MNDLNQITNAANAATLGFFASDIELPLYYKIPIAAAYTTALVIAFKHNSSEERKKLAIFCAAFITLALEFTLDYFMKAKIDSPFMVACLLLLNIINSRLNLDFTRKFRRFLTIQEEGYLVQELEESSRESSTKSFINNPTA